MPGFVTHELFGTDVARALAPGLMNTVVQKQFAAFRLGLQGPDLLFYDVLSLLRTEHRNVGAYLHEHRVGLFFGHFIRRVSALSGEEREIGAAYLAGFLCHHGADRFCHPYIYARSGHQLATGDRQSFPVHARMENEIDAALLWRKRGQPITALRQADAFCLTKAQRRVVSDLFGRVLLDTMGDLYGGNSRRISPRHIRFCIWLARWESRLQMDARGWKARLFEKLERLLRQPHMVSPKFITERPEMDGDCLNLDRQIWRNPWAPSPSNGSVLDLYGAARTTVTAELGALEGVLQGREDSSRLLGLIADASYHSGLPGEPPEAQPAPIPAVSAAAQHHVLE